MGIFDDGIPSDATSGYKRLKSIILGALNRTSEVTGNVIEVVGDNEFKANVTGNTFDNFTDALFDSRINSFRQFDEIANGLPTTSTKMMGGANYGFLEEISRRLTQTFGADAAVQRISVGTDEAGFAFAERQLARGGILVPDDTTSTILRFLGQGKKEMSAEEIGKFLNTEFGMTIEDTGKVFKRMKQITNVRSANMWQDTPFKVGVFDPDTLMPDLAKHLSGNISDDTIAAISTEGMSGINPATVKEMRQKINTRIKSLLAAENSSEHRGAVDSLRRLSADLTDAIDNGGRFNMRMIGVQVESLGGDFGDILPENIKKMMSGQIKGDVEILHPSLFKKGGIFEGKDLITSVHNVKREIEMTKGAFLTLETGHYGDDVFADVQSLSHLSKYGAVDADDLFDYTKKHMDEAFERIASGNVPEGFIRHMQAMAEGGDDFALSFLKNASAGVPISRDPASLSMLSNAVRGYYQTLTDKKLTLLLPEAKRAKLTTPTFNEYAKSKRTAGAALREGFIQYDPRVGWVLGAEDFAKAYRALGGSDLDDTAIMMLRYDDTSESLKVLGFRQPNAMGEHVVFNIDTTDDFVIDVLNQNQERNAMSIKASMGDIKKIKDDINKTKADIRRKYRALRSGATSKEEIAYLNELERGSLKEVDIAYKSDLQIANDAIKIAKENISKNLKDIARSGKLRTLDFTDLISDSFQSIDSGIEGARGLHPAFEMMTPTKLEGSVAGSAGRLTVKTMLERMQTLVETRGQLGRYSNARMIADTMVASFGDDFGGQIGIFKVAPQESIIDTLIGGFRMQWMGDDFNVAKITDSLYEEIGYQAARLYHESGGTKGVDRELLSRRGRNDEQAMLKMREGFGRYAAEVEGAEDFSRHFDIDSGVGPFSDHENSYWRRVYGKMGDLSTAAEVEASKLVEGSSYPDSIMKRGLASTEVQKDAEKLLTAYAESKAAGLKEIMEPISGNTLGIPDEAIKIDVDKAVKGRAHANVLNMIREWVEVGDDGKMGDYTFSRIAEAMRMSLDPKYKAIARGLFSLGLDDGPSMLSIKDATLVWSEESADWLDDSQRFFTAVDKVVDDAAKQSSGVVDEIVTADLDKSIGNLGGSSDFKVPVSKQVSGSKRAGERAVSDDLSGTVINAYKRIKLGDIKELLGSKRLRKGAVIGAGIVAFSFGYQALKDRSPEDMQGTPMLPGGEMYSVTPPMQIAPTYNQFNSTRGGGGVTYRLNASNIVDYNSFVDDLANMVDMSVTGSVYKGPKKNDIFSDIKDTF